MADPTAPPPKDPPLPAAAPAVTEEAGLPTPPLEFWRRPWVQNVLPFASSIIIHLAILIALIATYQVAEKLAKVVQEQIIIPDAALAPYAGGVPNPGLDQDSNSGQNTDASVTESSGFSRVDNNMSASTLANSTADAPSSQSTMMPGAPTSGLLQNPSAGALAQFGNPGSGSIGPHGKLFGHGGNATRIVYICDASGSMLTKMDLLKLELQKSVQDLSPVQAFNVVFFHESSKGFSMLAPDLMMATSANKRKLYNFLDNIEGHGDTHVIPALSAVFNMPTTPDLIYLLTDGAFEDETGPVVIAAINRLNGKKKVKINPVFLTGKPGETDAAEMRDARTAMNTIAHDNGGVFNERYVNELGN